MEKKLPEFKPLPELGTVCSNYMSAFNVGMNIYEALTYLQGYVQVTYNSQKEVVDDWNNLETWVQENLITAANEKTQEILQGWLDDGTLAETIKQSAVWAEKVDVAGDTMTGDLQFTYNHGLYNTSLSGDKVGMIVRTNNNVDEYTQIGDDNSKAVIHSESQPVWSNNGQNKILLTQEDLDTLNEILSKAVYFKTDGDYDTFTDENGDQTIDILTKDMVINNLKSILENQPLSANQGRVLKGLIDTINGSINTINGSIDTINGKISTINTNINSIKRTTLQGALRIKGGTVVRTMDKNGVARLFLDSDIVSMLDVSSSNAANTVVVVSSGDRSTYQHNIYGAGHRTYEPGTSGWYLYSDAKSSGNFRANYIIIVFGN